MASQNSDLTVSLIAKDRMTQPIKRIQSSIIRFVGAVSAALAAVRVTAFPIQQALDFDRAMRDVQKTTNFTDNQIVKLSSDLNKMGTELAVTQQELATIAAVGGQLGLGAFGVDAIREFTESVARAQVTLGLTAEQTAEIGAQLLNIFNIDVSRIENVFSLINELTNNSIANAADLADIMKRVGDIAGITIEQSAALSAYARDLGITAEVAGTSYAKFFTNLSTQAEDFAKVMNISTQEWVTLVEVNAVEALLAASKAIGQLDSVAKASAIKELFGGGRLFSFGSKLVGAASKDFERFYELLGFANTSYAEGTSSIKEYENILKSVKEQFNVVGNSVRGLAIEVGNTLLPNLEKLAKALQEFLTSEVGRDIFLELGKGFKSAVVSLEEFVAAIVTSDVAWGDFLDTMALILKVIIAFIGLELGAHIVALVARWYTWIKAMATMGSRMGSLTKQWIELKAAEASGGNTFGSYSQQRQAQLRKEALDVEKLKKEYFDLIGGIEAASRKSSKLFTANIKGVGNRGLGTEELASAQAAFNKFNLEQQQFIIRQQQLQRKLLADKIAGIQAEHAAAVASWKERSKLLLAEREQYAKNTAQYAKANAAFLQAKKAHTAVLRQNRAALKTLEPDLAVVTSLLEANTAAHTRNAAAIQRKNFQMFRSIGLSAAMAVRFQKLASILPRFNAAIIATAKVVGTLQRIGRGVLAIFGGWAGLLLDAALAVWFFWDDIKAAFSRGTKELTEQQVREQRAALRQLRTEAQDAIAAYESAVSRSSDQREIPDLAGTLQTKGYAEFANAAAKAADAILALDKATLGASVRLASYDAQLVDFGVALTNAEKEAEALKKELAALEKLSGSENNYENRASSQRAEEIKTRLKELEGAQRDYHSAVSVLQDQRAEIYGQELEFLNEIEARLKSLVRNNALSKEAVSALNILAAIKKAKEEQISLEKRLEEAEKSRKESGDAESTKPVAQDEGTLRLKAQAKAVEQTIKSLTDTYDGLRRQLDPAILQELTRIEGATYGTLVSLLDVLNGPEVQNALRSQEEINQGYIDQIKSLVEEKVRTEELFKLFQEYREPIDRMLETIDGMFDNLGKSVSKTRKELQGLGGELDEIIQKRKIERELAKGESKVDKALEKEKAAINKHYDDLIKREVSFAQTSGRAISDVYIAKLEKRREAELDAADAASESKKAELEANVLRKQTIASQDELVARMKEMTELRTRLNEISGDSEFLSTEAGREELDNIVTKYRELVQTIDDSTGAVKDLAKELAGIDATEPRFPGDTSFGVAIVPDTEITAIFDFLTRVKKGYGDTQREIVTLAQKAGQGIRTALDVEGQQFAGVAKQATDALSSFTKQFGPELTKAVTSYVESFRVAFSTIRSDYQQTISDLSQVSLTPSSAEGFRQYLEDTLSGQISGALSSAISEQMAEALELVGQNFRPDLFAIGDQLRTQYEKDKKDIETLSSDDPIKLKSQLEELDAENVEVKGRLKIGADVELNAEQLSVALRKVLPDGVPGRAQGGPIYGPGTSTSDSILARLSRGEFVMKAAAVKKYGLNFMHYLNSLTLPGFDVPKFAFGGLVGEVVNSTVQSSAIPSDRVAVDLNVGGETHTLFGEREQVRNFIATMKRIGKGS